LVLAFNYDKASLLIVWSRYAVLSWRGSASIRKKINSNHDFLSKEGPCTLLHCFFFRPFNNKALQRGFWRKKIYLYVGLVCPEMTADIKKVGIADLKLQYTLTTLEIRIRLFKTAKM
jgi:hypothetical protein